MLVLMPPRWMEVRIRATFHFQFDAQRLVKQYRRWQRYRLTGTSTRPKMEDIDDALAGLLQVRQERLSAVHRAQKLMFISHSKSSSLIFHGGAQGDTSVGDQVGLAEMVVQSSAKS